MNNALELANDLDTVVTESNADYRILKDSATELRRLAEENKHAMREASSLALSLYRRFYQTTAPNFSLCDSPAGVITQIDNMIAGIIKERDELAAKLNALAKQKPVGWLFQNEETGLTEVVDAQQVEWGFEKNNPRWQKIHPVYAGPIPAPVADEREATAYVTSDGKMLVFADQVDGYSLPDNCRQRLMRDGKSYPRSSCAACGQLSPKWRECDAALAAAPTHVGNENEGFVTPQPDNKENGQ